MMSALTSPWILCVLLSGLFWTDPVEPPAAVPAASEASDAANETSVAVLHDLDGLAPRHVVSTRELRWLPLVRRTGDVAESDELELGEMIESLVYDVVAPEAFEYEGRAFHRMDDGRLLVVGPPALQERIARLIDGVRAAFGRRARLGLDVYEVMPGRGLPGSLDGGGVRSLAESGVLRLLHQRQDQVLLGNTERIEALNTTTMIKHWDGEIAQNMTIAEPDLVEMETGLDLTVRAEAVPGSSALRLRHAVFVSRLDQMLEDTLRVHSMVQLDNSVELKVDNLLVDLPIVSGISSSGSTVLSVGEGLVLVGQILTHEGSSSWVVHLRLLDVDPDPGPMEFGDVSVAVVDTSAVRWPRVEVHGRSARTLAGRNGEDMEGLFELANEFDPHQFPASESFDWEGNLEACEQGLRPEADERDWEYEGWGWSQASWAVWAAAPDMLARRLEALKVFTGQRRNLVVELGVSESAGPGGAIQEVARGRLLLESGSGGSLVVGDSLVLHRGFRTDVATGAALAAPLFAAVFDGLSVHVTADGRGETVDVRVASSRLLERSDVSLSSFAPGSLERPSFALADVRASLPVDGQRHVVAELDAALEGGAKRSLWVSVHAR